MDLWYFKKEKENLFKSQKVVVFVVVHLTFTCFMLKNQACHCYWRCPRPVMEFGTVTRGDNKRVFPFFFSATLMKSDSKVAHFYFHLFFFFTCSNFRLFKKKFFPCFFVLRRLYSVIRFLKESDSFLEFKKDLSNVVFIFYPN